MAVQAARVTVGTTATRLDVADASTPWNGTEILVRCPTADIYVGGAGVTTATGFLVPTGTPFSDTLDAAESLYAVAASSVEVHVYRGSI